MKVLISNKNKFLIKDTNQNFQYKGGFITKDKLKEAKDKVITPKGEEFYFLEPEFIDEYENIKRGAQVISLKDVGAIITETGINGQSRVLDAGTGSAALTCYLAHIVKEVVTYELRDDFAKVAKKNIDKLDLKNVKLEIRDIYEGIEEKDLDLITLDLREPWRAVKHCHKALRKGAFLVGYTPQITQALELVNAAVENGFVLVKVKETAEREWRLSGKVAKPITPMLSHTGFLSFLRKV